MRTATLLGLLAFCDCHRLAISANGVSWQHSTKPILQAPTPKKTIKIKVDIKSEQQLQKQVDNGHQPWRLEPIDVAIASIAVHGHEDVDAERCSLVVQKKAEATAACRGGSGFVVKLKRLVKPNGIWTAVEIQITP
jgi:hypothetical protein